jgi:hypothetical protein
VCYGNNRSNIFREAENIAGELGSRCLRMLGLSIDLSPKVEKVLADGRRVVRDVCVALC